ncbi:MAG: inorganic phosphate transporter [Cryomorphaceae bacterium]|nr:inorganic phosphate transporter [Cryomorphaceae bacterium]
MLSLLIVIIVIALLFDLVNGFHDAANSIATVVSTKVLTPFQAVVWAAVFNFAAFWVFDMSVGNTVAKTVDNSVIDLWVILAGLLAATAWNLLTWWLGLPSSSSHTLIGGFAGAAIAHAGFDVLKWEEIIKPILFIFLAPVIGGIIAFLIALVTIQRSFIKKIGFSLLMSAITVYASWYYKDFIDLKPIMIWIIGVTLGMFLIVYIGYQIIHGRRQTAMKESTMYKRLQLLSSAAFSLGHGGADSQKVMGIICAALIVFANGVRDGSADVDKVPDALKCAEIIQIKYHDDEGKVKKFKPSIVVADNHVYYTDGKHIMDGETNDKIYEDKKLVAGTDQKTPFFQMLKEKKVDPKKFDKVVKTLKPLLVYTKKKEVRDLENDAVIFTKKTLDSNYRYAGFFKKYVDEKSFELLDDHKLETKVNNDSMPWWIAFACYLMIGLGTLMGGWKIVKTMGTKITKVTPLEGVCAETAGALTLFTVSQFGIPVSTTHTITGSIIGVGATKRLSAVRWGVTVNLLWAWILTIPVSAMLAAIFYYVITLFN